MGAVLIAIALKEEKKDAPIMTQLKRIDYPGTEFIFHPILSLVNMLANGIWQEQSLS